MPDRLRRAAGRLARWLARWLDRWPEIVALVPLMAAAARALAAGWIPVGENAVISLRAADVLTGDHPWVGTASSVSVSSGAAVNHPGPALFDLLALPVKLLGPGPGVVLGLLALHSMVTVVAVRAARRCGGRTAALLATATFVGLSVTLGPELVLDPWNPHVLLMPLLALLWCVTAVGAGRSEYLPWAAGLGSLVLQIHVSTALLVPSIVAVGLFGAWRTGSSSPPWRATAIVIAAFWVQPVWQQLFGAGDGNLWALASSGGGGGTRVGLRLGARLVADVVAVPPFWMRPSFERTFSDLPLIGPAGESLPTPGWLVGSALAALLMVLLLGSLSALAVATWRRGWHAPATGCAVAVVALAIAVASASSIPRVGYGVAPHQLRFLWPIALWWMATMAWAVWVLIGAARRPIAMRSMRVVATIALAVGVVGSLPSYPQAVGVARATLSIDDVRRLVEQIETVDLPPVRLAEGGLWIGEPFTIPVLEALWADDQPVWVDDAGGSQFGRRRVSAQPVGAVLYLRAGAEALLCAPGALRIALVTPIDAATLADPAALAEAAQTADLRTVAVFVEGDDGSLPVGVVGAAGAGCS